MISLDNDPRSCQKIRLIDTGDEINLYSRSVFEVRRNFQESHLDERATHQFQICNSLEFNNSFVDLFLIYLDIENV